MPEHTAQRSIQGISPNLGKRLFHRPHLPITYPISRHTTMIVITVSIDINIKKNTPFEHHKNLLGLTLQHFSANSFEDAVAK